MGTNTILAIGALIIFGTFLSSSDRLMTANTQIAEQNEYVLCAISLGQSVIEEAKTKAFDQYSIGKPLPSPDSASTVLGRDGLAEFIPMPDTLTSASPYSSTYRGYLSAVKFNDVDDYNGYSRLVNTPRAEKYTVSVKVSYRDPSNPDNTTGSKTFCKLMTVSIKSPFISDSLTLSYAFFY